MKVLIFEWLSGGGLWHDLVPHDTASSIQSQGFQMLQAITTDFLDAGAEVVLPIDERLEDKIDDHVRLEKRQLCASDNLPAILLELAEQVDQVMLVAPETDSCLLTCLGWVETLEDKLISPDSQFVRIASCKKTTFEQLRSNGFEKIPHGLNFGDYRPENAGHLIPPLVLKPIDGAGSEEVQLVQRLADLDRGFQRPRDHYWLEQFISGTPVSVSILCGPEDSVFLPPTQQLFDRQPFGSYIGAGYPIDPALARRAKAVAEQAINSMPPTRGYVGIDMVLSDRSEPQDSLIEINPRLTMSYLKLRAVCRENLAKLMLAICCHPDWD